MNPGPPAGVLASTDRILPTGGFTSPAAGNVSGVVTLAVSPADNDRIASVQFKVDGGNYGAPVTSAPWQVNYDTRAILNGAHTYSAVITDRIGNQITTTRGVTHANAPITSIYSPANGAAVTGTVTFAASNTNYSSSVSTQLYIDGGGWNAAYGGTNGGYGLDTHMYAVGWHTLTAITTDAQGNTGRSDISVYVNNQIPAGGQFEGPGDQKFWDSDAGGYYEGRYGDQIPTDDNVWGGDWMWSGPNASDNLSRYTTWYLPGNPNPTYYQMRVGGMGVNLEGSSGGVITVGFLINGAGWYVWWQNGALGSRWNVNGGEGIQCSRWRTPYGNNNAHAQGIYIVYDFVLKYAS